MQPVLYPGHAGQPCAGEYAIALDHSDTFTRADIVLVSRLAHCGASFCNADFGRDAVLNRILATELKGIRLEWIRVFLLVEKTAPRPGCMPNFFGIEITRIELDTDDYVAKGNRCTVRRRNILSRLATGISREICYWSGDVVGGRADVTTSCEHSRHLGRDEIHDLCRRIGMPTGEPGKSIGRDNPSPGPTATKNTLSSSAYH